MQGRPGYSPCEIPELLLLGLVFGIGWHVKVAVYSQQAEEEHWRMHVSDASIVAQCASCLARYCVLETGSSRTIYHKREASTHEVVISNLFHAEKAPVRNASFAPITLHYVSFTLSGTRRRHGHT